MRQWLASGTPEHVYAARVLDARSRALERMQAGRGGGGREGGGASAIKRECMQAGEGGGQARCRTLRHCVGRIWNKREETTRMGVEER